MKGVNVTLKFRNSNDSLSYLLGDFRILVSLVESKWRRVLKKIHERTPSWRARRVIFAEFPLSIKNYIYKYPVLARILESNEILVMELLPIGFPAKDQIKKLLLQFEKYTEEKIAWLKEQQYVTLETEYNIIYQKLYDPISKIIKDRRNCPSGAKYLGLTKFIPPNNDVKNKKNSQKPLIDKIKLQLPDLNWEGFDSKLIKRRRKIKAECPPLETMKFEDGKYVKLYLGSPLIRAHVDAIHAHPPDSDEYTGEIAEKISEKTNCSCIIALISRDDIDLNRERTEQSAPAIDEYRNAIARIQQHVKNLDATGKSIRPYLHIAIHGMSDKYKRDVEIGTRFGQTCSNEVKNLFVKLLRQLYNTVAIDQKFIGDESKNVHRNLFGEKYNTIQLEISRTIREFHREQLIENLCSIIRQFNTHF